MTRTLGRSVLPDLAPAVSVGVQNPARPASGSGELTLVAVVAETSHIHGVGDPCVLPRVTAAVQADDPVGAAHTQSVRAPEKHVGVLALQSAFSCQGSADGCLGERPREPAHLLGLGSRSAPAEQCHSGQPVARAFFRAEQRQLEVTDNHLAHFVQPGK